MDTDQILDLFDVGADDKFSKGAASAKDKTTNGDTREEDQVDAMGQVKEKGKQGWLDGLGELWDQGQYEEEYNLDEFLGKMKG